MQDSTRAANRARKAPPGTWTGQSNAYASVAKVSADHEAPSQAEARRGDDRCERRVSTHGECHYSKLWWDFHPDGKESPQVKDRSPQRKGKKSNSDASSSDAVVQRRQDLTQGFTTESRER